MSPNILKTRKASLIVYALKIFFVRKSVSEGRNYTSLSRWYGNPRVALLIRKRIYLNRRKELCPEVCKKKLQSLAAATKPQILNVFGCFNFFVEI